MTKLTGKQAKKWLEKLDATFAKPPTRTEHGIPAWESGKFIVQSVAHSLVPIRIYHSGGSSPYAILKGGLDEAEEFGQSILSAVEYLKERES